MKAGTWTVVGIAACVLAVSMPGDVRADSGAKAAAAPAATDTGKTPNAPKAGTAKSPDAVKSPAAADAQPTPNKVASPEELMATRKARIEAKKAAMRNEKKVDINNASRAEIQSVLGISEADADKVIAARPLGARSELVTKVGLPEGVYLAVRSKVVINEPRKRKTTKQ